MKSRTSSATPTALPNAAGFYGLLAVEGGDPVLQPYPRRAPASRTRVEHRLQRVFALTPRVLNPRQQQVAVHHLRGPRPAAGSGGTSRRRL